MMSESRYLWRFSRYEIKDKQFQTKANLSAQFGLDYKSRLGGVARKPILAEKKYLKSDYTKRWKIENYDNVVVKV